MDLASVVAALASVGVRVSGSTPNSSVQGDSSRACPTGLAGPELSGTINDPGQHFHGAQSSPHNLQVARGGTLCSPHRLHTRHLQRYSTSEGFTPYVFAFHVLPLFRASAVDLT